MSIFSTGQLPAPLSRHLEAFTEQRPDWTQERILSSALSLFLLQNGVSDRAVSEVYLRSMFGEFLSQLTVKLKEVSNDW